MFLQRYVQILQESTIKNIDVNSVMFDNRMEFTKVAEEAFVSKGQY